MRYFILLVFLLTSCGGSSSDGQIPVAEKHIGSWFSECQLVETDTTEIVWATIDYQFETGTFKQTSNYYLDANCTVVHDAPEFSSPLVVDGTYDYIGVVTTDTNVSTDLYSFTFYPPPPATENITTQYGLFIENDVLYFVLETFEGVYTIFYDYPLFKKEI